MKRIKRFGVYQTAKVAAILYFFISLIFVIPIGLFSLLFIGIDSDIFPFMSGGFIIAIPFFYALIGFIFTALFCVFYNLAAKWTGGIEMEVETTEGTIQST